MDRVSKTNGKFLGIIQLNYKITQNQSLEIMTYDELQHNNFVKKIIKFIPRK